MIEDFLAVIVRLMMLWTRYPEGRIESPSDFKERFRQTVSSKGCENSQFCLRPGARDEFPRTFLSIIFNDSEGFQIRTGRNHHCFTQGHQIPCWREDISFSPAVIYHSSSEFKFPLKAYSILTLRRSKVSTCLLVTDPRSRYAVRLPHKLPGMHYSADEQCQILFGTNATFCKNMEVRAHGVYLETRWEVEIKLSSTEEEKQCVLPSEALLGIFTMLIHNPWSNSHWSSCQQHILMQCSSFPCTSLVYLQEQTQNSCVCTVFPSDTVLLHYSAEIVLLEVQLRWRSLLTRVLAHFHRFSSDCPDLSGDLTFRLLPCS